MCKFDVWGFRERAGVSVAQYWPSRTALLRQLSPAEPGNKRPWRESKSPLLLNPDSLVEPILLANARGYVSEEPFT